MYRLFFKRIFDFVFSLLVLFFLIFPFFIVFLAIIIDSRGPVFFLQERMGLNKKKFKVIKFRTMTNKPRDVSSQTYLGDSEITKIGHYLRRFKIDELPQFINVLKGDMSVVGPRPCLEVTYNRFRNEDTDFRFIVKPGVTSNAGVSGSIFLTWPEKWAKDKEYAIRISFKYDLYLIFSTIVLVFVGEEKFINKK
jgi:undecaprenyl phosphate N,N'-diacetylbacillosamine 1-phosphate transferase